jgi:hypothetical protein
MDIEIHTMQKIGERYTKYTQKHMERDLKDNTNKNYNTRSTVREVW